MDTTYEEFERIIRDVHNTVHDGDTSEYHEIKLSLPRSMKNMRPIQILKKITEMNPSLENEAWTAVSADIINQHLVLGTMTQRGLELLNSLQEIKLETTMTTPVPKAKKPDNLYWIDLLYPPEVELRVPFLMKLIQIFPSGVKLSNPGKRPLGLHRRTRLHFNSVVAPRSVFTHDDPTIPIREISLACGSTAQILHKWPRLNSFIPPSVLQRGAPHRNRQSYAAAAAHQKHRTNADPDDYLSFQQPPIPRPGIAPNGPPALSTLHTEQPVLQTITPTGSLTKSRDINPQSNQHQNKPTEADDEDVIMAQDDANPPDDPRINDTTPRISANRTPTTPNQARAQNQGTNASKPQPPKPNRSETQLEREGVDEEWETVSARSGRSVVKRKQTTTNLITSTNRFESLDAELMEQMEGTDFKPLAIPQLRPTRRTRRRQNKPEKGNTDNFQLEMKNPQEIRHPIRATRHITPEFCQFLLATTDPGLRNMQRKLVHQTALIRSAREKIGDDLNTLDEHDDSKFLSEVQARISRTSIAPTITETTPIITPINALHDSDRQHIETEMAFAWLDTTTRAYAPLLYTLWPDKPLIGDQVLSWLPSPDKQLPCLRRESLKALAQIPMMQPVWSHASQHSDEVTQALRIVRAQGTT